jgi:hypothetical protein
MVCEECNKTTIAITADGRCARCVLERVRLQRLGIASRRVRRGKRTPSTFVWRGKERPW